ncbi:thioredoxin family protein [Desulfovibrio aminophilus]|nr:thioredoxin family protein [Desulfovibrio aminophilus]MCM0755193.1 thioredoxin family protein [Desulfovibrio aminophilus]
MNRFTKLEFLTPAKFKEFISLEKGMVLCALLQPSHLMNRVLQDLVAVAQSYEPERLQVKVFDPEYLPHFAAEFRISGAPAYLVFFAGVEQRRFLGIADLEDLREIIAGPAFDVTGAHL